MSATEMKFRDPRSYAPGDVLISEKAIDARLTEMAQGIAAEYQGKGLVLVGLLKGAFMVMPMLASKLHDAGLTDMEVSFMTVKSYANGTTATSEPQIIQDMDINPAGRHVLVVDDISDTRRSLDVVSSLIRGRKAASVRTFVLLDKPDRKEVDFTPDYVGFTIPNVWAQGMGMDTDGEGRCDRRVIVGPHSY